MNSIEFNTKSTIIQLPQVSSMRKSILPAFASKKKKGKLVSKEKIQILLVQPQIMKKCQCKTASGNHTKIHWKSWAYWYYENCSIVILYQHYFTKKKKSFEINPEKIPHHKHLWESHADTWDCFRYSLSSKIIICQIDCAYIRHINTDTLCAVLVSTL